MDFSNLSSKELAFIDTLQDFLSSQSVLPNLQLDWFTEEKAMGMLQISKSTIQSYRRTGKLPFSKIKNKFFYRLVDINQFLEDHYSHPKLLTV